MGRGVVVIGEVQCAPREYSSGFDTPTCIWLGEPPDASPVRKKVPREKPEAELLSFREALALLKVSRNTLYRLVNAGEIPGVRRVGRAWRFHRASLIRWISGTGRPDTRRRRRRP